jgi:hypothetical protein
MRRLDGSFDIIYCWWKFVILKLISHVVILFIYKISINHHMFQNYLRTCLQFAITQTVYSPSNFLRDFHENISWQFEYTLSLLNFGHDGVGKLPVLAWLLLPFDGVGN